MKLGDCATFINGYAFKPTDWSTEGLPIIRIQDLTGSMNNTNYYNGKLDEKYLVKNGDILISWSASLGIYEWKNEDAYLNQHIFKVVFNKEKFDKKYFIYLIKSKLIEMQKNTHGSTMKHITKSNFDKIEIPKLDLGAQITIGNILSKIEEVIHIKEQQINNLNELIKSKFIAMFGDPIKNTKQISIEEIPTICEIIDGDRGKNYPKAEEFYNEEYCLFLNAKNVTSNGFAFENCMFITEEKDKLLRKGKLQRGDVVLTTRGTVGNIALYTDSIPYDNVRINSGMVILRMNRDLINEIFFIEQFKLQIENIKSKFASGSAQPQLPISKMNNIKILIPRIEEQNKFSNIVKQIDKQKFKIQKSLEEMQNLQESLMNKYFG